MDYIFYNISTNFLILGKKIIDDSQINKILREKFKKFLNTNNFY